MVPQRALLSAQLTSNASRPGAFGGKLSGGVGTFIERIFFFLYCGIVLRIMWHFNLVFVMFDLGNK
jgi:hypothetical protein